MWGFDVVFFLLMLDLVLGVVFMVLVIAISWLVSIDNSMCEVFEFSFDVPSIYDIICYVVFVMLVFILLKQKLGY